MSNRARQFRQYLSIIHAPRARLHYDGKSTPIELLRVGVFSFVSKNICLAPDKLSSFRFRGLRLFSRCNRSTVVLLRFFEIATDPSNVTQACERQGNDERSRRFQLLDSQCTFLIYLRSL